VGVASRHQALELCLAIGTWMYELLTRDPNQLFLPLPLGKGLRRFGNEKPGSINGVSTELNRKKKLASLRLLRIIGREHPSSISSNLMGDIDEVPSSS
jgi:hypothetical protein